MNERPYNRLGQIIATGGMTTLAVRMANGSSSGEAIARLEKKYGTLEPFEKQSLLDSANSGLIAGNNLTRQLQRVAERSQSALSDRGIDTAKQLNVYLARSGVDQSVTDIFSPTGSGRDIFVPFEAMPAVADLFGDNPSAYRAMMVTQQDARRDGGPARVDFLLSGGETWLELIGRAVSWRNFVADYDPYRFDDMEDDEIIDLSIRVVAGWRKW